MDFPTKSILILFEEVLMEKVYFRSQILERPSIGEYWNIFSIPVLPENEIFTFFRTCWCYSEAYNTETQNWSSIVKYLCTNIWDFKYTFSVLIFVKDPINERVWRGERGRAVKVLDY